jgi:hypothetical protein
VVLALESVGIVSIGHDQVGMALVIGVFASSLMDII